MQDPSLNAGQNERPPSSPAYGGVVVVMVIVAAAILLTYTLSPLPGQRELGVLNYAAATALLLLAVILLKRFRPARITHEDTSEKPRVRR